MVQIINEFISAILQVILFTLVPFIFFLFRKNKSLSFFAYIGLTKPTMQSIIYVIGVALLFVLMGVGLTFINEDIKQAVFLPNSVTGKIRLMGFNISSVSVLLIMALIKTSLSEEIFFRGFLAKRLINKLGFKTGNILQAMIFGLIHLLLFWLLTQTTFIPLIIILVFSSFAGWAIGYIKEKYANGSIIPGWVAHGLGNTLSYSIIAFVI
jgi:membrane protease YdiL (CAAX protease family)